MKNLLKLSSWLFATLLLFVSCTQSDVDDSAISSDVVTFTGSINQAATKALANYFETDDEISVTAYYNDDLYAENVKYIYNGSMFTSSDPIILTYDINELSYWAVYPYCTVDDNVVDFSITADQSVDNAYTLSDLMRSCLSETSGNSPSLVFSHLLSNVVVNLSSDDVNLADAKVEFSSATDINFNIETGNYTTSGEATQITAADNGTNCFKAIVLPQTIDSGELFAKVSVDGSNVAVYAPSELILASGCQYTFNFSVSGSTTTGIEVEFLDAQIEDWQEGNGEEEEDTTYSTLADFSSTSYPADIDTWEITDTSAELDAFYGLRDALYAAYDDGRQISLVFPNLTAIPSAGSSQETAAFYQCHALASVDLPLVTSVGRLAFFYCRSLTSIDIPLAISVDGLAFASCISLASVDMPLLTSVAYYAFSDCSSLASIDLPLVTSVGESAFTYCNSLSSMSLATGSGVQLSSIGSSSNSAFYGLTTSDITLTLGSSNKSLVSDNTLTVGSLSETFKEIILVDENGDVYVEPDEDNNNDFVLTSGATTLYGYSYFDDVWYSENVTIDYDSSTGDVTIYGLFYGYSSAGVAGTYDADAKTISVPDWQTFGTFGFSSGDTDVYFANANDYDDIVFTLNSTETAFETSQWWGYYVDGLGWYDLYTSSYFDVITNISATYTLYGYSYFDDAWYSEDVVLSLDSAEGTASISGLFYGYSPTTVSGTYDKSAGTISVPDWQLFGTFGFSSGDANVYFTNAIDYDDIVFTLNSVGTAYETSQWWGYYVDGLGWYDLYTTSYLSPSTASAAPAVYAKAADRLDLATVSTVSAPKAAKSVVAPTTSLKSTMTIGSQVKAASSKASNLELNSINASRN